MREEAILSQMSAEQLKFVLKRLAPGSKATRKADVTRDILAALESPEHIDRALARLQPFEARIMQELKQQGGTANGFILAAAAAIHGYQAPAPRGRRAGNWYYSNIGVSAYLQDLLDGGILLPASRGAEWFEYGTSEGTQNLVTADSRLLARVGDDRTPPPPQLDLPQATPLTTLPAPHPAAVVLQLHGVLQLVGAEGGVQVTKKDEVAKPFLKRLERAAPELAKQLQWALPLLRHLRLVGPPIGSSNVWRLDSAATSALRSQPLTVQYARIVDAHVLMPDSEFLHAWRADWRKRVHDAAAVWRATLEAIALLPRHPVTLTVATNGVWESALARVFGRSEARPLLESAAVKLDPAPAAILSLIGGQFVRLGLLQTGWLQRQGEPQASAPADAPRGAVGATDLAALGADAALRTVQKAPGWSWFEVALYGSDASLGARADAPSGTDGPALLVQPNFEILAYLDRLDDAAMLALACASVTRIDAWTATFTIDRRSFEVALETGATAESVLDNLNASSPGVPRNVADSLGDWAARRERLTLTPSVNLIEYHSSAARDLGLRTVSGARPVGETFLALPTWAKVPAGTPERDYDEPPPPTLRFRNDGTMTASGQPDLALRWALASATTAAGKNAFRLNAAAVKAGSVPQAALKALHQAAKGGIPARLDALLRSWSGATPPPALAKASLFRHPDATLLAEFKEVGGALGPKLSPSTYLVEPGKEAALAEALKALGLSVGAELAPESGALKAAGEGDLVRGLSTRKTRELLEAAIEAGHEVELEYANEVESWTAYGSYRRSRGKVRKELVRPESITYAGSTPYLVCYTASRGAERVVRIGYIDAIAVRWGGFG